MLTGSEKLGIGTEGIVAVDEADGTEIDDYNMLVDMSASSCLKLILLEPGQTWMKASADVDNVAYLSSPDEGPASAESSIINNAADFSVASSESKSAKRSESQLSSFC